MRKIEIAMLIIGGMEDGFRFQELFLDQNMMRKEDEGVLEYRSRVEREVKRAACSYVADAFDCEELL